MPEQLPALTEPQRSIVEAIGQGNGSVDEIIEATGLSTSVVLSQLTVLEIRGVVRRQAGLRVVLNTKK